MTVIKRRQFLQNSLVSATAVTLLPIGVNAAPAIGSELLFSACTNRAGEHQVSAIKTSGDIIFQTLIPERAHDMCYVGKNKQAIFFSRRPGKWLYIVSLDEGRIEQTIQSPAGRHFYGHGILSVDQQLLYTSENNYETGKGVIGVYSTETFTRVDEFSSGGVGPHQIELINGGKTLVVANGGIQTHPKRPREKLNIETMHSTLTYIDLQNYSIIDSFSPENHQMSLRHLSIANNDTVAVAVQYQGDNSDIIPLVLTHSGEGHLQALPASELTWLGQNQYIASVAFDPSGRYIVSTSPRGHTIELWDVSLNKHCSSISMRDVAGAVYSPSMERFIVSSGRGQTALIDPKTKRMQTLKHSVESQWDNHLALATV